MEGLPWNAWSSRLRERYGGRVLRVAVDAGFSCPHRNGGRTASGCSFCPGDGGRAPYLDAVELPSRTGDVEAVRRQVTKAITVLGRRDPTATFMLFFQAYTGTFATARELARLWDAALALADFRGLAVATRPDCLDDEKAMLLASYRARGLEVWVELGLQSACDQTLRQVNRGHSVAQFAQAANLARASGLRVAAHVILGLPGEGRDAARYTGRFLSGLGIDGVKIHDLHVVLGTPLAREHLAGEIAGISAAGHLERTIALLEQLPQDTVVMRLTCDTPTDRLLSPRRSINKMAFARDLAREMHRRSTWQGRCSSRSANLDPALPLGYSGAGGWCRAGEGPRHLPHRREDQRPLR